MNEQELTETELLKCIQPFSLDDAATDYIRKANAAGWEVYYPNAELSEQLISGGWLLRDNAYRVIAIVERDAVTLVSLAGDIPSGTA